MEIHLRGQKSICEEIAEEYEKLIRYGVLREGEKLPSCRTLALQLGINPNTVERAFNELERRGFVRTIPKKGVFVHCVCAETHTAEEAKKQIFAMKEAGLSLEQIISFAREIFKDGDRDDRN